MSISKGVIFFVLLFALDRLTKLIVLFTSSPTLTFNAKTFFLLGDSTASYGMLAVLVAVLGAWFIHEVRTRSSILITSAAAFIVAGALSNFLDRVRYGAIIDWIAIPGLTVFNFADLYIVVGCLCIFVSFFWRKKV